MTWRFQGKKAFSPAVRPSGLQTVQHAEQAPIEVSSGGRRAPRHCNEKHQAMHKRARADAKRADRHGSSMLPLENELELFLCKWCIITNLIIREEKVDSLIARIRLSQQTIRSSDTTGPPGQEGDSYA
jgi:hypothetical protein